MNARQGIVLVPKPAVLQWREGECIVSGSLQLSDPLAGHAQTISSMFPKVSNWPQIELIRLPELRQEEYKLAVDETKASISFAQPAGGFYGLVTLGQIITACEGAIPCCEIKDFPALGLRGLMLDISRGKVPALDTLFMLADILASIKINHLELYIEGFSFAYPSFPELWQDRTPLTPEEIQRLDAYCAARFIELVPNQNSLGHMGSWLAEEKYRPLAEKPEGFTMFGFTIPPTTMNPKDDGTLEHVIKMTDDLLPNFTSEYFNVNLDEPFELGQGHNSEEKKAGRIGEVYLEYAIKLRDMLTKRGKRMMMWGDFAAKHPELIKKLPKDITILEWGYEAEHPFEKRSATLKEAGLQFCICPGTSSWSSYAGITDNMLNNVRRAASSAHSHGAHGLLLTDWGDGGHPQVLPVSYPAYALAASLAWNTDGLTDDELAQTLNTYLYKDSARVMGTVVLELGRFNRYEEFLLPCRTIASLTASAGIVEKSLWEQRIAGFVNGLSMFLEPDLLAIYRAHYEKRREFDYEGTLAFLNTQQEKLDSSTMAGEEGARIKREYSYTIATLRLLTEVHAYNVFSDKWQAKQKHAHLSALQNSADALVKEHEAVWVMRSKPDGVAESRRQYENIRDKALEIIGKGIQS